jgi:hypothetical protein
VQSDSYDLVVLYAYLCLCVCVIRLYWCNLYDVFWEFYMECLSALEPRSWTKLKLQLQNLRYIQSNHTLFFLSLKFHKKFSILFYSIHFWLKSTKLDKKFLYFFHADSKTFGPCNWKSNLFQEILCTELASKIKKFSRNWSINWALT